MTEEQLLIAVIQDKISECSNNSVITYTDFLDLNKQSDAVAYACRQSDVKWMLYGGYDDAERKMMIFIPYYIDDLIEFLKNDPESAPWVAFRADKDNFSTLSHRDYLGALTGMGIKREKLGDIIVDSGGCSFFAKPEIASYIESEFTSAGRGTLKVRRLPCFNDFSYSKNTKEKLCFVSSLRLDSVVSAVFSLSRTKASDFIEKGFAFVNDRNVLKPDYKVKEKDKIVIKGLGRAILKDGSSKSKKGRVALTAEIFI